MTMPRVSPYVCSLALVAGLLASTSVSAQIVRTPYVQMLGQNRATIVWRTDTSRPADSRVRYGTTQGNLVLTALGAAGTPASNGSVRDHVVTISGLSPATRYYYAFGTASGGDDGGDDALHYFETAPVPGTPTRFRAWVLGDSGNGNSTQAAVRDAATSNFAQDPPQLFLHMGDIAYTSGTDSQFTNNHFAVYSDTLLRTSFWPAIGNHEAATSDSPTQTGAYYEGFILPTGGEFGGAASGTEAYYSFDYANVHFVVVDTADSSIQVGSTQLNWLQSDLASTVQDWIVVILHHPPYTKGSHNSDSTGDSGGRLVNTRENVLPILEAGGADLVLAGHSHIYERSYLIDGAHGYGSTTPSFSVLQADGHILDSGDGRTSGNGAYTKATGLPANQGTVYIVAGHGGQGAGGSANHPVMYFSETQNGSCMLTVNGNTLSLENIRRDGVISDTFTMLKQVTTCNVDADCADGNLCTTDQCIANTCQNPAVVCGGGQSCDSGSGQCVDPPSTVTFQAPLNSYAGLTDTFISEANPSTAYGTQADAEFDADDPGGSGQSNLLLVRMSSLFDTNGGPIPAGSQITSASLQFTIFDAGSTGDVHEALVSWNDATTYNTFGGDPGADPTEYGARIGGLNGGTGNQSVDVTASLAAWSLNPGANNGWLVRPSGTNGVQIRTGEYFDSASHPSLTVNFIAPSGGCPATCPGGTACRASTQQCEAVSTATFRDGISGYAGTEDTFLRQGQAGSAQGTSVIFEWDGDDPWGSGMSNSGLVRMGNLFDTNGGPIPAGAQILSAQLDYTLRDSGDAGQLHEALVAWDENTTYNSFGNNGTPGVDPSEIGPALTGAPATAGTHNLNVTSSLQAWSGDPASNYGWAILPLSTDGAEVFSNEHTVASERPGLTVTWFTMAAQSCVLNTDCDDANLCTSDTCNAGTCTNSAVACSSGQTCDPASGACVACFTGPDCADGDLCTTDACVGGACQNPPVACSVSQTCDPASGQCVECFSAADCNDGSLCTTDTCNSGTCSNTALTCTGTQTCDPASGQCICNSAADCGDGNLCTVDTCNAGVCSNPAVACSAGQSCNPASGQCSAATCPASCPSGTACRTGGSVCETLIREAFEHGYGWFGSLDTYVAEGTPTTSHGSEQSAIWDADAPTSSGLTSAYLLKMGMLFDSEGGPIPAGAEISSALLRYWVVNSGGAGTLHESLVTWDESTTWNTFGGSPGIGGAEISAPIASLAGGGGVRGVDILTQVQAWSNNPASNRGLVVMPTSANDVQVRTREHGNTWEHPHLAVFYFAPPACAVSVDCDDGSLCTTDSCVGGSCQNSLVTCGSGQSCDPASGQCVQCLQDTDCSDADMCTTDVCNAGACTNNTVTCTGNQTCDPASGQCVQCFQDADCTDSDMCTTDACVAGACTNNVVTCTGNQTCDPASGQCIECFSNLDCDDTNLCTTDVCNAGTCANNAVACTNGQTCDPASGQCVQCQQDADCSDSDMCTTDVCNAGACTNTAVTCTGTQACDPASGQCVQCLSNADCDDADLCTTDVCNAGSCANNAVTCTGGQTCDPASGQCTGGGNTFTTTYQEGVAGYAATVDTFLMESDPTTARGGQADIEWDADDAPGTGLSNLMLVRMGSLFDTEGGLVPQGSSIVSATLEFTVFNPGGNGNLHETVVAWDNNTTYNTFGGDPGADPSEYGAQVGTIGGTTGVQSVDVTASVNAWSQNPSANLGWVVLPTTTDGVQARSSEYATLSARPKLTITYQAPAGCLATCPTGTACRPRSQQCEATTRIGFEHGYGWFGSLDTDLAQSTPNTSHGTNQAAGWDSDDPASSGQENIYLLKMGGLFDSEGGTVPAGAEIAHALLRYWVVNSGTSGTIHESTVIWDESTTYNSFGGDPGVDASEVSASIATVSGGGGVQSVDLTTQVQAWSNNPSSNLGLVVMPTGTNGVQVRTREHGNTWEHPHLNIFFFTNP